MIDLPDLPPDLPLDPVAKARLRTALLEAADAPSRPRRWLVPLAAAASVAVVAGGVTVVTDDRPQVGPAAAPLGSPSSALSASVPSPTVSALGCGFCDRGEAAVTFDDDLGRTTFYVVDDDRWALRTVVDDSTSIVTNPRDLVGHGRPGPAELAVEQRPLPTLGPIAVDAFVAGGLLPPQDTDERIVYTFSDGHRERARLATDDEGRLWWLMTYSLHRSIDESPHAPAPVPASAVSVTVTLDGQSDTHSL